ncbi:MAG: S49 family peptidase [Phycisphaerae bacterium]|nr:S49 family peptidase [Phycisphaerae bacterium]
MPNWSEVFKEIQGYRVKSPFDAVRLKYLTKLHKHTGRNVIAYYSGFLSKPGIDLSQIVDEDKDGFMMAIHRLDRSKGLDLVLHTEGGDGAATESIVDYLRRMFGKNVRAVVPQIAMSAGTMIACSCRQIVMAKHSSLGPIDPQLRGIPALGVVEEFERACREIKADSTRIPIWQAIIGQYRPTFLSQCENAIAWSRAFVAEQLEQVMFSTDPPDPNATKKASNIVQKLSDYTGNKGHNRHLNIDECKAMGLDIVVLENDAVLQDLVLTIHHCYMHLLQNTLAYKVIENHKGVALIKNWAPQNKI